jgi:hypothetical protein
MNPVHKFTSYSSEFVLVGKPEGKIPRRSRRMNAWTGFIWLGMSPNGELL